MSSEFRFRSQARMPWPLLAAASLAMFTAAASGTTRAPFLIDMARDLSTSVPFVANLMAMTSVAWGLSAMVAGAASDRWGRRPLLVGGPIALAGASAGIATAADLLEAAIWFAVAGACCGTFTGPVFTEVSRRVSSGQQGRALGWVMSGQSLTLLVGVPLAAWIGAGIGWRGVSLCVAALAVLTALCLFATTTRGRDTGQGHAGRVPSMRAALSGPVLRLLSMGVAERICYGLVAVYFATFLQSTFDLTVDAVALPLAVFAVGNIVGTVFGGQLADRLPHRLGIFATTMLASGVAALALFGWRMDLIATIGLGFVYVFFNAIARPSLMASLGDVPEHVRGTVMGLNVTCSSLGWLGAAGLGGWMIASYGFTGFGPLTMGVATVSAGLALVRRF
ncbi:MAG: MFS transporter [Flavobacteriaceae bacterium]